MQRQLPAERFVLRTQPPYLCRHIRRNGRPWRPGCHRVGTSSVPTVTGRYLDPWGGEGYQRTVGMAVGTVNGHGGFSRTGDATGVLCKNRNGLRPQAVQDLKVEETGQRCCEMDLVVIFDEANALVA